MRKETAAGGISREEYVGAENARAEHARVELVRAEHVRTEYVGTEDGASENAGLSAGKDPSKEVQKKWELAGIGNDYLFSCVMRDESLFLRLMQRVFPELHLTRVCEHTTQKTFVAMLGSKSIRLDVYSEIDDKIFNVEMQLWSSRDFDPARRMGRRRCSLTRTERRTMSTRS